MKTNFFFDYTERLEALKDIDYSQNISGVDVIFEEKSLIEREEAEMMHYGKLAFTCNKLGLPLSTLDEWKNNYQKLNHDLTEKKYDRCHARTNCILTRLKQSPNLMMLKQALLPKAQNKYLLESRSECGNLEFYVCWDKHTSSFVLEIYKKNQFINAFGGHFGHCPRLSNTLNSLINLNRCLELFAEISEETLQQLHQDSSQTDICDSITS